MKKKITALCLVVALALVAIGGATMAYFTDNDKQNNTFAIGNIDIKVDEYGYVYDSSAKDGEGAVVEGATAYTDGGMTFSNLMPSYIVSKRPYVKNESTSNAAYVRVAVTINNARERNAAIDEAYEEKGQDGVQEMYDSIFYGWGINNTAAKDHIEGYTNGIRNSMAQRDDSSVINIDSVRIPYVGAGYQWEDWNLFRTDAEKANKTNNGAAADGYYGKAVDENSNLYVFYLKLEPGETYYLFSTKGNENGGLNIPADFNNEQMKMFDGLQIGIYADAIQTVGFSGENAAVDAFTALEAEHPLGWWKAE